MFDFGGDVSRRRSQQKGTCALCVVLCVCLCCARRFGGDVSRRRSQQKDGLCVVLCVLCFVFACVVQEDLEVTSADGDPSKRALVLCVLCFVFACVVQEEKEKKRKEAVAFLFFLFCFSAASRCLSSIQGRFVRVVQGAV